MFHNSGLWQFLVRPGGALYAALLLVMVWPAGLQVYGQDSAKGPCEAPEFRQFDFWVGEWDLRSRSLSDPETDTWETSEARNRVRIAYDSCVVIETFEGAPATPLRGTSVSSFNPGKSIWQQTWVDNFGGYMTFEGGLDPSGRMILSRSVKRDTATIQQRMVFDHIAADSLDWYWERSTDHGASWMLLWHLHYTRRR